MLNHLFSSVFAELEGHARLDCRTGLRHQGGKVQRNTSSVTRSVSGQLGSAPFTARIGQQDRALVKVLEEGASPAMGWQSMIRRTGEARRP